MTLYGIIICVITIITLSGNCAILLTLTKSKCFNRSIKLHLGLISALDSITTILLTVRYILDELDYLDVTLCKVIIGSVGFTGTSLAWTNLSMTIECLVLMCNLQHSNYGCLHFKSWRPTRKSKVFIVMAIILSVSLPIGCILADTGSSFPAEQWKCVVTDSTVYHPFMLKLRSIQNSVILMIFGVFLSVLVYQLCEFNRNTIVAPFSLYRDDEPAKKRQIRNYKVQMDTTFDTLDVSKISVTTEITSSNQRIRADKRETNETIRIHQCNTEFRSQLINSNLPSTSQETLSECIGLTDSSRIPQSVNGTSEVKDIASEKSALHKTTPEMAKTPNEISHTSSIKCETTSERQTIKPTVYLTPPTPHHQQLKNTNTRSKSRNSKRKSRVVLMAFAACFYMCCYTPYVIAMALYTFCPDHCGVDKWFIKAAATFTVTHGLLNVVLYIAKNREFRLALLTNFRCRTQHT